MTLSEMFAGDETRTFEERRDEVVSLVVQATDLEGHEQYLRRAVARCIHAHSEQEFDQAYQSLVSAISAAPLSV